MPNRKTLKAPKGISAEAAAIWKRLHAEYELTDEGAAQVLDAGLRAFDTMRQAEATLAEQGLTIADRFGGMKAHPCVDIAHRNRAMWLGALRMLGLHREGADNDQAAAV